MQQLWSVMYITFGPGLVRLTKFWGIVTYSPRRSAELWSDWCGEKVNFESVSYEAILAKILSCYTGW